MISVPALPSSSIGDFNWPTFKELAGSQEPQDADSIANLLLQTDGLYCDNNGAVWIPDAGTDLQLRLSVIVQTGPRGHRAASTTEESLHQHFVRSTLSADIDTIDRSGIHCILTIRGGKNRFRSVSLFKVQLRTIYCRSFTSRLQRQIPTKSRCSCCAMTTATIAGGLRSRDTSSENATRAVIDWCAAFRVPSCLTCDDPTHFTNEALRLIAKGWRLLHHFTIPYNPWSNGGVKRPGKELLCFFPAVA